MGAKNGSPEGNDFFPSRKKIEENKHFPSVFNTGKKSVEPISNIFEDEEISFSSSKPKKATNDFFPKREAIQKKVPISNDDNEFFPKREKAQEEVVKQATKEVAATKVDVESNKTPEKPVAPTKPTKPNVTPAYNNKIFGDKINTILNLSDINKLNSKQLLAKINDTKIWLDINSPKEWDKWIELNKDKLPVGFKETFAEKFPDLYADVDASIAGIPGDINSSIQNEAKRLYNQKKGPYTIDFNSLSDDLIIDLPLSRLGTKEMIASFKAQGSNAIPLLVSPENGTIIYKSKEEALRELVILQGTIEDVSDGIQGVVVDFFSMIGGGFAELYEDMENNDSGEFAKDISLDALLILIHISVWMTIYRKVNTFLIKKTSGKLRLPFIKGGDLERIGSGSSTSESAAKEKGLMEERDFTIKRLRYIYAGNKSKLNVINGTGIINRILNTLTMGQSLDGLRRVSDSQVQDSKISGGAWEPSFNRKVVNINANGITKLWHNSITDTFLKVILGRTHPDSFMERSIETKNNVLKALFNDLTFEVIEVGESNRFEKIDARYATLKGNFKQLLNSVFLSHSVLNADEKKIKKTLTKYIQELKDGKIPNIESLDTKEILKAVEKELTSRIKDAGIKIDKDFIEKSKKLEDAKKTLFNDKKKGQTIKDFIDKSFENQSPSIKAELHGFYTEVNTGSEKYDIRTAIDIIVRIRQGKTSENATKESFKVDSKLIESIEKKPTTELMLGALEKRISKGEYNLNNLKTSAKKWTLFKKKTKPTPSSGTTTTTPKVTPIVTARPSPTIPTTSSPIIVTPPISPTPMTPTPPTPKVVGETIEISEVNTLKNVARSSMKEGVLTIFIKGQDAKLLVIEIDINKPYLEEKLAIIEKLGEGNPKKLELIPRGNSILGKLKSLNGVSFTGKISLEAFEAEMGERYIETTLSKSELEGKPSDAVRGTVKSASKKAKSKSKTKEKINKSKKI